MLKSLRSKRELKINFNKVINIIAILLIGALGVAGFMVMNQTAESNKVTADIAKVQSERKSRVVREVALLTAELRNLQKDIDAIMAVLRKIEKAEKEKK